MTINPPQLQPFYEHTLPPTGPYTLFRVKPREHYWVETLEELVAKTESLSAYSDVYFATASFVESGSRTQENVAGKKCFYLDLDAGASKLAKHGPEKIYATQQDALDDVVRLSKEKNFFPSLIVSSGEGLHVYYEMDTLLSHAEWTPIAKQFQKFCISHGLKIDSSVTADSARILRPIGTLHPNGKTVTLLKATGKVYSVEEFTGLIGHVVAPVVAAGKYAEFLDINADIAPVQGPPKSLKKLLTRCEAARHAASNQDSIEEPYWRLMIGLAKHTTEGREGAHMVSCRHPEYDAEAVDRKFDAWATGPTTCATFEGHNPKACAKCEHRGKIKSPIVLGAQTVADVATVAVANAESPWSELEPLIAQIELQEYPLDALPDLVRCAVQEVAGFVKAPIPLIAASALAALSMAIQTYIDVERAEKLSGPVGLFLLAIADSGERKSTSDGFFTKAIRDYEAHQQEAAKPLIKAYESERDAWEAQRSGIKEAIKAAAKSGKSGAALIGQLHDLDDKEPVSPRVPRLIYGDATPEALTYALAKKWPSGGVISSEAGSVFGGHGMGADSVMRNLATLNQLWDGATLPVERRSTESFTVRGARLTMALQVQEATIRAFFVSTKGLARGTGFLARFLVSWPVSTQGTRNFTEAPDNWPALATFNKRLTEILDKAPPIDDDGALTPAMLTLSPKAKAAWIVFHDAIESKLSAGRELFDVRDVASKTADNAARLAALFHVFTGNIGPIDIKAMKSAARVTAWHLSESRRFLSELAMPAEVANPARLESWMLDYCRREQTDKVPTREIQRMGPGGLRDKVVFTEAVKELAELGRARQVQVGKKKSIQIRPELLVAAS